MAASSDSVDEGRIGRTRYRLDWEGDGADGPDDSSYVLFSEHVRGEPRFYWPMRRPPGVPEYGDHWERVDEDGGTRKQAMAAAERDALRRVKADRLAVDTLDA